MRDHAAVGKDGVCTFKCCVSYQVQEEEKGEGEGGGGRSRQDSILRAQASLRGHNK